MPRGRIQRSSRRKGKYLWSGLLFDELLITSTPQGFDIVASADFTTANGRSEVTLMGIRGWLSFSNRVQTVWETAYVGICKRDSDESTAGASQDPSALSYYIDEDILYTTGYLAGGQTTAVGQRESWNVDLNVKSRRKLSTGQNITMNLATAGANSVLVSGVMRAIMLVN